MLELGKSKLFSVELVDDIRPYKAIKLMYNAAISPLAAAAGVDNGELLTDGLGKKIFLVCCRKTKRFSNMPRSLLPALGRFILTWCH